MNRRSICPQCDYIKSRCICESLAPIFNQINLIILQHPSETKHALNTVRLMKNSFQKITVFIGENFNEHSELKEILAHNKVALIFPKDHAQALTNENNFSPTHLIFIDGPWKKAKKIYFCSPLLHTLAAFALTPSSKSRYTIRSSNFKDSLSTLEASIEALKILEPNLDTNSLEKSFLKMIDNQIEKMGALVFEKNYKKKSDE